VLAHTSRALQGACPSPRPLLCCRCRKTIILHGLRADAAIAPGTAGTSPARTRHAVAATEAIISLDELGFPTRCRGLAAHLFDEMRQRVFSVWNYDSIRGHASSAGKI